MTLRSGEIYFSEQDSSLNVPETISLFGLSISFYGLFLVVATLIGIIVTIKIARRKRQDAEWSLMLITLTIVSALLGARLYYVLFEWQVFLREPIALLDFRSGGLSYFGALFGAWFMIKWYCRRKGVEFARDADTLCIGAAAATPLVWAGCAFMREPIGRFYDGLFAMRIGMEYLPQDMNVVYSEELISNARNIRTISCVSMHPVAVYGVIISIVAFVILCFYMHFEKQEGATFVMYLFLNAVTCIVLECFRADRSYIWGTEIPVNYVVAGVIVLVIVIGWIRQFMMNKKRKRNIFTKG